MSRSWYWRNKVYADARSSEYQRTHRAQINIAQRRVRAANRKRYAKYNRRTRLKLRAELIIAYGGKCRCCPEREPAFLTVDHIFNDGAAWRKKHGIRTGEDTARYLRRMGWPKDRFQLLCANCNLGKLLFGQCPHKLKRRRNAFTASN